MEDPDSITVAVTGVRLPAGLSHYVGMHGYLD